VTGPAAQTTSAAVPQAGERRWVGAWVDKHCVLCTFSAIFPQTGEADWLTVAYIPVIRPTQEPGAALRERRRRAAIVQRVLYLVLLSTIVASHVGVRVRMGTRGLVCFPRLLLYICDLPEEKSILRLKWGKCTRSCSMCDLHVTMAGAPQALNSQDRDGVKLLQRQVESTDLRVAQRYASRRLMLEEKDSALRRMPALASLAGLSTEHFVM